MRRMPVTSTLQSDVQTDGDKEELPPGVARLWKYVGMRMVVRVVVVVVVFGLAHMLGVDLNKIITDYTTWVDEVALTDQLGAVVVFWVGAVVFNAVSPTGYLPTVLAGATFRWYIAWPVAYTQVNAAAMLNMFIMRSCGFDSKISDYMEDKLEKWEWLNSELRRRDNAFRVVVLIRLPFLWNGLFNYIFSLSNISARDYFIGNAIGFIPGSLLFSRLGAQARSILKLLASGNISEGDIFMLLAEVVFILCSIGALAVYFRRLWAKRELQAQLLSSVAESASLIESDSLDDADFVDDYFSQQITAQDGMSSTVGTVGTMGGLSGAF